MAVITISRELGSEGDKIADLLCQELGYSLVDKAMLTQIAQEAGVDVEAVLAMEESFARRARLVSTEMSSLYSRQPTAFEKKTALDDKTYERVVRKTLEEYARQGNVIIVGRGGQMVLRDWPSVIHVQLYSPIEIRIQRLMERFNISEPETRRRITESDEQKKQYIRYMFKNADWKDPRYYHLTINTALVPAEIVVQIITMVTKHQ
jgi:cytidylate kinase